jgi:hypothetical protein
MKLVIKQFLLVCIILMGFGSTVAWSAPVPKVEVCHIPPGNPENVHTIRISENALPAHLAHSDLVGACNANCAVLCDDGNACTIDDDMDCEENGCPTGDRAPTDCNDNLLCTNDSCDPGSGCMNDAVICDDPDLCTTSMCSPSDGQCVDAPVSCPDGFTCSLDTGICEEDVGGGDPECAGQTCSTFTTCNAGGSCGTSGICASTGEGGGLCVNGSISCSGLSACATSNDCGGGETCLVNTCCGAGVCVSDTQNCSNPEIGPTAEIDLLLQSSPAGPTIGRELE